jgi:hypothetical protein
MVEHLIYIVLMALVATGAHIVQEDGMILHPLAKLLGQLPAFLHKPLFTCPVCMVSVWGIPAALYFGAHPDYIVPYLLASAGLAAYLNR